jgi:hypothetical protein
MDLSRKVGLERRVGLAHESSETMQSSAVSPMSSSASRLLFRHPVLGKYPAGYYYDQKIGYIFAREPHWLDEAYSEAMSSLDTGALGRNLANIDIITRCLSKNGIAVANGIDLGAGYGLFVRGMRDKGIDFYWSDRYCENLLAKGFEAKSEKYDVAVAFEVFEHLPNPIAFLLSARKEFQFQTCFFSATCFDEKNLPGADWSYWAFEGGQHISFFSMRALLWMAEQLDMRLCHIQSDVFAFSNLEWQPLTESRRLKLWRRVRNRVGRILHPQQKTVPESLTWSDHLTLREKMRNRDAEHVTPENVPLTNTSK